MPLKYGAPKIWRKSAPARLGLPDLTARATTLKCCGHSGKV